ncbi:MAG: hypothetical protein ACI4JT_00170 [Oscillospiraceae bacterium]
MVELLLELVGCEVVGVEVLLDAVPEFEELLVEVGSLVGSDVETSVDVSEFEELSVVPDVELLLRISWLSVTITAISSMLPSPVSTLLSTLDELLDSTELDSTELSTLSKPELSSGFSLPQPAKSNTQEIAAHKICFFISSPSNEFTLLYHLFANLSRIRARNQY